MLKNKIIIELSIIFLFIVLYIWNIANYFWIYPLVGDPYSYLAPILLKSHYNALPPIPFFITPIIGMGIFALFIPDNYFYLVGPTYTLFIHVAILSICALWLYNKKGLIASVAFCIFFNCYFQFLSDGTYIRMTQTELLFLVLAFITFFSDDNFKTFDKSFLLLPRLFRSRFFFTGLLCAFAVLSKSTAIIYCLVFFLYIIFNKKWKKDKNLLVFILGGVSGTLIIFSLYIFFVSFDTFLYSMIWFFNPKKPGWTASSGHPWVLVKEFPLYFTLIFTMGIIPVTNALVLAPIAYANSLSRKLFLFAWLYIFMLYLIWFVLNINATASHDEISIYTFAAMGVSAMFGDIFNRSESVRFKAIETSPFLQSVINIVLLLLVCTALTIGFRVVNGYLSGVLYNLLHAIKISHFLSALLVIPSLVLFFAIAMGGRTVLRYFIRRSKSISYKTIKTFPALTSIISAILLLIVCYGFTVGFGITNDYLFEMRTHLFSAENIIFPGLSILSSLLVLMQFLTSRTLVTLFLISFAFLVPPHMASFTSKIFMPSKEVSDFFYDEVPFALRQIPYKDYGIYIEKWIYGDTIQLSYAVQVYRLCFDRKWPKAKPFTPQNADIYMLPDSKIYLVQGDGYIPALREYQINHILTDNIEVVKKYFPHSKVIKTFNRYQIKYYVIEINFG